jgi:hypothetical protein
MLLARRLMSKLPAQDKQRLKSLRLAAREFNMSLSHFTRNPSPGYIQVPAPDI